MSSPRWRQILYSLGLEFWLPLPLLGFAFWVGCGLVTDQLLSRPYGIAAQLKASPQLVEVHLAVDVLVILAEIQKSQGFTKVQVKTTDSVLKKLEFQFPVTQVSSVEAKIAQELKLSPENVRKLVRYQIKY